VYATLEYENRPGGELRALARNGGEERWAIAAPPQRQPGGSLEVAPDPVGKPAPPVVTPDLIVTALSDRRIQAVTHGGEAEWSVTMGRGVGELAGAGETLVVVTHDQSVEDTAPDHVTIKAFNPTDGSQCGNEVSKTTSRDSLSQAGLCM